jgi:hypothetical protein
MLRGAFAIGLAFALAGCFAFSAYDEPFVGPYRLLAVDTMEDMILCRAVDDGGSCGGDGLPDQTIFAAGADDRYIVLARHPRHWPDPANRAISEFYYVVRAADEATRGPEGHVHGPFDSTQFASEVQRLHLPGFSKVLEELR